MRKMLALFLILVLPLQATFAAGAEYCESTAPHGSHIGHHGHDVENSTGGSDAAQTPGGDCGFCHLGCSHVQISEFQMCPQATQVLLKPGRSVRWQGITASVPDLPPKTPLA